MSECNKGSRIVFESTGEDRVVQKGEWWCDHKSLCCISKQESVTTMWPHRILIPISQDRLNAEQQCIDACINYLGCYAAGRRLHDLIKAEELTKAPKPRYTLEDGQINDTHAFDTFRCIVAAFYGPNADSYAKEHLARLNGKVG